MSWTENNQTVSFSFSTKFMVYYFRSYLYAATLDKARSSVPSAKPGKQAANAGESSVI